MSTRYVWDKYNVNHEIIEQNATEISTESNPNGCGLALSQFYSEKDGFFTPEGSVTLAGNISLPDDSSANEYSTSTYPYAWVWYGTYAEFKTSKAKKLYYYKEGGCYWAMQKSLASGGYYRIKWRVVRKTDNTHPWFKHWEISDSRGDAAGGASAQTESKYPSDGVSGDTWYVYKGSDSIDPIGLSASNQEPSVGETITLTVTPGSNTYGGTISYQYQYSTDGGSNWVNIGSKTTSTTQQVTIPENAERFQARVLASDDWGFTSTDYVYSTALEVSNGHWYIGVNGVARKTKRAYIGVNGVARRVKKGYIGVNGVARQFYSG